MPKTREESWACFVPPPLLSVKRVVMHKLTGEQDGKASWAKTPSQALRILTLHRENRRGGGLPGYPFAGLALVLVGGEFGNLLTNALMGTGSVIIPAVFP